MAIDIHPGTADELEFDEDTFDVVMLATSMSHIFPTVPRRLLREMRRAAQNGGDGSRSDSKPLLHVESHSRSLMGWPGRAQKVYWKLGAAQLEHDFFVSRRSPLRSRRRARWTEATMVASSTTHPSGHTGARERTSTGCAAADAVWPWAWQVVLRPTEIRFGSGRSRTGLRA